MSKAIPKTYVMVNDTFEAKKFVLNCKNGDIHPTDKFLIKDIKADGMFGECALLLNLRTKVKFYLPTTLLKIINYFPPE